MQRIVLTVAILTLIAGVPLATPVTAASAEPGVVVDSYFAAYRAMDLERMLRAYTADAEFIDIAQRHRYEGAEGMRQLLSGLLAIHTEMDIEIQRRATAGNLIAVDYLYRGTLSGEALRAATGKETCRDTTYSIPVTSWFEIENGRIRRQTDFIDLATLAEVRAEASGATSP